MLFEFKHSNSQLTRRHSNRFMANDPSLSFRYQPLDDQVFSIRILNLEPSPRWDAPIQCRLNNATLHPVGLEYEALSYTWDSNQLTDPIVLDGSRFNVSSNLSSFLRHRREKENTVQLWVDGICINQQDTEEKSRQVQMMNLIYTAAPKLVIWLGPSTSNSDLAMEYLSDLGSNSPFDKMPILSGDILIAIKELLSRRWWSRVWIVQEVFWGGVGVKINNVRLRCGQRKILWINLVIAAARMQAHADDMRQHFPAIRNILGLEKLRDHGAEIAQKAFDNSHILRLVSLHRKFQATDPRDKVFALLGLIRKYEDHSSRPRINYSVSTREVYTTFARMSLRRESKLEILRHCNERLVPDLPSWAPDWSVCSVDEPLPGLSFLDESKKPWYFTSSSEKNPKMETGFEISGTSPIAFKLLNDSPDIKPFRLANARPKIVRLDKLPPQMEQMCSADEKISRQNMINAGRLIIVSSNDEESAGSYTAAEAEARLVKRAELVTHRNIDSRYDALSSGSLVQYRASGTFLCNDIRFTAGDLALAVDGLIFDHIQITQPPFPTELAANWERATHFLIAVARCKSVFLAMYTGSNAYGTHSNREVTFWLTLFAGRTKSSSGEDLSNKIAALAPFWLRHRPAWYTFSEAPLTATSPGRLETGEIGQVAMQSLHKIWPEDDLSTGRVEIDLSGGAKMREDLQPEEWTDIDREHHRARFDALAELWQQTPYDLYARPFDLPAVVPDPFWACRQRDPELLARAENREFGGFVGTGTEQRQTPTAGKGEHERAGSFDSDDAATAYDWEDPTDLKRVIRDALRKVVPLVPAIADILEPDFEQYALGRRMFGTTKGCLGIGPQRLREGDVVAILKGLEVPLVLRERQDKRYEVVGEAYVHGIMDGEAFDEGKCERIELV